MREAGGPGRDRCSVIQFKEAHLPKSIDAERSVLGGILIDNASIDQVVGLITEHAFYSECHRKVFAALIRLVEAGSPLDLVTLKDELTRAGTLDQCGGPAYLAGLLEGVPHSSNVEHYAQIVLAKARRRDVVLLSRGITDAALNGTTDVELAELIGALVEARITEPGAGVAATAGELAGIEIELSPALICGIIDEGNRGFIFGDSQARKSLLALTVLVHVGAGLPIAGWRVAEPMRVAMLFLEDRLTPSGDWPPRILWRLQSVIEGLRPDEEPAERQRIIELVDQNFLLCCGPDLHASLAAARKHGSKLTVIDSWNCVCPDDDTDMVGRGKIRQIFDRTHDALENEAFLFLDNTNKGGDGRHKGSDKNRHYGSVGKRNVSDLMLLATEDEDRDGNCAVSLKATKGRDGLDVPKGGRLLAWDGLPVGARLPLDKPVPLTLIHVRDNAEPQDIGERSVEKKQDRWAKAVKLVKATGGERSVADLAELLGVTDKTVHRWTDPKKNPDTPLVKVSRGTVGLLE